MKTLPKFTQGGFTVAEMVVSTMIMAILGIVFLNVLNSGMILYAKNTAVNSAHEEGREGINRLTRDIHAAVSVPQLRNNTTDANYTVAGSYAVVSSAPVNGAAPTAQGVSFQNVVTGSPDFVWKDPNNANLIMINDNPNPPVAGMRLIVPFWAIEDDIQKATASGSSKKTNVFLAGGGESGVVTKAPTYLSGDAYAVTYYTDRVLYVVEGGTYIADSQGPWILSGGSYVAYTSGNMQRYRFENGQLNLYKQRSTGNNNGNGYFYWQFMATVARYVSSAQPFYVPLNSGGSPDTRYVGVKLSVRDPSSSNRGYLATSALLDTKIDYRSRICLFQ
ncbi:MAG TPA: hypothetical protein VNW72_03790 [Chthoniobacterales bacterium]|jgi:hypothetical protein|nr:hypothetical protein [Chthoniobacterales bacterium]